MILRPGSLRWWILIIALVAPIIVISRSLQAVLLMLLIMLISLGTPFVLMAYVLKRKAAEQRLQQGTGLSRDTWRNRASSIGVYAAGSWPFLFAMFLLSARWGGIYALIFIAVGLLSAVLLAIAAIAARGPMRKAFGLVSMLLGLWWLAPGLIPIFGQPSE